ncbi:hypothetical protein AC249_AIPGENE420 [Exaiptasia diaphana]|nr:hypothetical protein AC249_AIPGENE420 [Exaiptasia diaphana]
MLQFFNLQTGLHARTKVAETPPPKTSPALGPDDSNFTQQVHFADANEQWMYDLYASPGPSNTAFVGDLPVEESPSRSGPGTIIPVTKTTKGAERTTRTDYRFCEEDNERDGQGGGLPEDIL